MLSNWKACKYFLVTDNSVVTDDLEVLKTSLIKITKIQHKPCLVLNIQL